MREKGSFSMRKAEGSQSRFLLACLLSNLNPSLWSCDCSFPCSLRTMPASPCPQSPARQWLSHLRRRLRFDEQVGGLLTCCSLQTLISAHVLDPCQSNPCEHGGNCLIQGDTFTCSCPAPFSGSRCQTGECPFIGSILTSELNKRQFLLQR